MPIALLTDFGTRDYFVAAMKGVILSIDPIAVIVDITHEIEPQNIGEASFVLRACRRDFPKGTVFVAVVDPGVGSDRRGIAVEAGDQIFIGPDNGIFSFITDKNARVFELKNAEFFAPQVSSTFHGRDVFAPVAAHISRGISIEEVGPRIDPILKTEQPEAVTGEGGVISGRVIHIDRFGNLVTNIPPEMLPGSFRLKVNGTVIAEKRQCYSDGPGGTPFLIVGSAGFLEISVYRGSARTATDADVGEAVTVTPA